MSTKHTPGPWKLVAGMIVPLDNSQTIASVHSSPEYGFFESTEPLANARLIAAAPELLEALKAFRSLYGPGNGQGDEAEIPDEIAMADAVIARAEGRE